ncbi:hypothetical protein PGT21_014443 [Puccinia graminis f. sp. tritici]|uniref:Uncharacterized protein n=1 Tax=Puccinia graminis f. sp. tritici TaxID=56615 RepID=A0A5B0MLG2_PUCGR|nr:hypothetical protein PGT21_014443 [Puccinia graminis f. sp. tritici]
MMSFIRSYPNLIPKLLAHFNSSPIVDVLMRIIQSEQTTDGTIDWLIDSTDFVELIISLLHPSRTPDLHCSVANSSKMSSPSVPITSSPPLPHPTCPIKSLMAPCPVPRVAPPARPTLLAPSLGPLFNNRPMTQKNIPNSSPLGSCANYTAQQWSRLSKLLSFGLGTPVPEDDGVITNTSLASSLINSLSVVIDLIRRNNSDYSEHQLMHDNLHFVDAILYSNPRVLDTVQRIGNNTKADKKVAEGGHVACRMSHRLAIGAADADDDKITLILKDDVDIEAAFKYLAGTILRDVPKDWDIIFFGHTDFSNEARNGSDPLTHNFYIYKSVEPQVGQVVRISGKVISLSPELLIESSDGGQVTVGDSASLILYRDSTPSLFPPSFVDISRLYSDLKLAQAVVDIIHNPTIGLFDYHLTYLSIQRYITFLPWDSVESKTPFVVAGSGKPLQQFVYSSDSIWANPIDSFL